MSTNPIRGSNSLKLGVFCANALPALTRAPELFQPVWREALIIAQMADALKLEALVPIARWKGYVDGDALPPSHQSLDPFTYAAALAQATSHIAVFATTHAPTIHPLVIAKQAATIDAISGGRFAMNVVGGWNRREFDMFGIDLLDHESRYEYLADWLDTIRALWTSDEEFDRDGPYFHMKAAISRPRPIQGGRIPIMNAGFSETGMRFAAKHSDLGLVGLFGTDEAQWTEQVARYKSFAKETFGRDVQVWTNAQVVLRDTDAEAQAYLEYYSQECADTPAIDSFIDTLARENNVSTDSKQMQFMRRTVALGSGLPIVGGAETVAETLASLSRSGLDGVIMSAVDYVDVLHRFGRDVLLRLEAAGLRAPLGG